jgi:RNA polymerase sigma factor (sigma-70 family)
MLRMATDARLVALVRAGNGAAFEAIYDRYHRPILSFCRHMLGDPEEAADAVQHSFMAAYNAIVSSEKTILLRAWLFTIARNRCYSVLRAKREQPAGELVEPSTEGLATQVQRREDLRELLRDLRRLPDDQRAALVLAELGTLSHGEIASTLDVPAAKVKALVFQARESLIASRTARDTDCTEIRRQLSTLHGGALRRGNLRRHLRDCEGCRQYRTNIELQRRGLAAILPVAAPLALKEAVLGGASGAGSAVGAVAGTGLFASAAFKGLALKGVLAGLFALAGTAGTFAVVHSWNSHHRSLRAGGVTAPGAVAGVRVSARSAPRHDADRLLAAHRQLVRHRAVREVNPAPVPVAHRHAAVLAASSSRPRVMPHRAAHRATRSVHHRVAAPQPTPPAPVAVGAGEPSDQSDGSPQDQGQGWNANGSGEGHRHGGDGQQHGF